MSIKKATLMRPTLFFFTVLLVCIMLSACNKNDIEYLESSATLIGLTRPNEVRINEVFSLQITLQGSSSCALYSRLETEQVGDTTTFYFYQKRDASSTCSAVATEVKTEIELCFGSLGTKYLHFNKDQAQELIVTIESR